MEMLQEFLVPMTLAICVALGYIIKNFLPMDNKYIPLIMAMLGVAINVWNSNFDFTPLILIQGLASGLASTGAFEMIRNMTSKG